MTVESQVGSDPDLEERLSPQDEAGEARRLLDVFKELLNKNKRRIHWPFRHWPYRVTLEQLPNGESLHAFCELSGSQQTLVLWCEGDRGGIHFFKAEKSHYPVSYGHSRQAVVKIEEFLDGLRKALTLPNPAQKTQ